MPKKVYNVCTVLRKKLHTILIVNLGGESGEPIMSGFSVPGIGSGIDWSSYINAVTKTQTDALSRTLVAQQTKLAAQQAVIGQVKGLVTDLQASISGFQSVGNFQTMSVGTSNANVATGMATTVALSQAFTVNVNQLATNEVWQAQFTGVGNSVTSTNQTLTINVRGVNHVVNVNAGTTLTQLAQQLNQANIGVNATVFDTGAGTGNTARLAITDSLSGKNDPQQTPGKYNLSFTSTLTDLNTASFGAIPVIEGLDSKIFLNGGADPIYRATNNVGDVVPGVTIQLLSTNPSVTLTVSASTADASTKMQDFIKKYNTLIDTLKKAIAFDPSQSVQSNPTASDSTLTSVLSQLEASITGSIPTLPTTSSITSLAQIGITTTFSATGSATNGELTFDQAKFSQALASNFTGVQQFFEGIKNGIQVINPGFGKYLNDSLNNLVAPINGVLASKFDSLGTQLDQLSKDIQAKSQRINANADEMKQKFANLEVVLSQLKQQQNSLSSMVTALSTTSSSSKSSSGN